MAAYATYANMTVLDAIFKERYGASHDLRFIKKHPLLDYMPRKEMVGDAHVEELWFGNPNVSGSRSNANTYKSHSQQDKWVVTTNADLYARAEIDVKAIYRSKNDQGAFVRAVTRQVDGAMDELANTLHVSLYGIPNTSTPSQSWPVLGVDTGTTGTTLTLAEPFDIVRFHKRQNLVRYSSTGSTPNRAPNAARDSGQVSNVSARADESTGTITVDAGWSAGAAGDYLMNAGFVTGPCSLRTYLPLAAPSATTLHGVDRTQDASLYGVFVTDYTGGVKSVVEDLLMRLALRGGKPDAIFIHPKMGLNLLRQLEQKVELMPRGANVEFGFRGATAVGLGMGGAVDIIFDPYCPVHLCFALQRDTWMLLYTGPQLMHVIAEDTLEKLRDTSSSLNDSLVFEARSWPQTICVAPGLNGCGQLALPTYNT